MDRITDDLPDYYEKYRPWLESAKKFCYGKKSELSPRELYVAYILYRIGMEQGTGAREINPADRKELWEVKRKGHWRV